jgi:hypothetical protein
MPNQEEKSVLSVLSDKIKSGQIHMRPRFYFVLKTILIVFGAVLACLLILFLVSFIAFSLHANGLWLLPGFGFRGLGLFFNYLPWILILMALALIVILEVLAERFSFVWRRPIIYSLLAIILVVFLGSFLINRTPLHPGLLLRAREGNLPLGGPIYRGFSTPEFRGFHVGVVSEIREDGFIIKRPDGQLLTIIVNADTQFPSGKDIKVGDTIAVMGERQDDSVLAMAVRRIEGEFYMFERRPGPPPLEQ